MAAFTLAPTDRFLAGTSVKAYKRSNFPASPESVEGAPVGTEDATAVTDPEGTTAFTGLTAGTRYVAHAEVSSQQRYIAFRTDA